MPESADTDKKAASDQAEAKSTIVSEEERMEDEEKILACRYDVNFPALLTKDVPGG